MELTKEHRKLLIERLEDCKARVSANVQEIETGDTQYKEEREIDIFLGKQVINAIKKALIENQIQV